MSNSFRVDASEVQGWHARLASRMDLRGVPAIAKEIEAHLAKKDADGTVVVTRHQLFTWAEALSGAAARDTQGTVAPVVADMRAILTGKPAGSVAGHPPASAPAPASPSAFAPAPASAWSASAPAPVTYQSAPPVTYVSSGAAALAGPGGAGGRVVSGNDLANGIRELLRGAQSEVCISSPWVTGIETLVADIVATAPQVRVLIVSRRPDKDEPAFHKAMDQLGRRKAITAWSTHIQTRYVIADGKAAIVGAASIPIAASREAGVAITDPATVAALRAHFDRCHVEAAGGRY